MTTLLLILRTGNLQDYSRMLSALRDIRTESLFEPGILSYELFYSVIDPLSYYVKEQWEGEYHLLAHLSRLHHHGRLYKVFQYLSKPPELVKITIKEVINENFTDRP